MKIENGKQYKVSKKQLDSLRGALEASINTTVEMPEAIYKAMLTGIQSQIKEVEADIEEYMSPPDRYTVEQKDRVVDLALNFLKSNTDSESITEILSELLDSEDVQEWERAIESVREYYKSL